MALTETVIPTGGNVPIKRPCLNIVSRGSSLHISQNVPLIGRPFTRDLVDALVLEAESDELCPFYLDLQPHFMRMLAVTKKAKAMDSTLSLLITQAGELHLQVLGPSVYLGCEFRPLKVFQTTGEEGNHPLQGAETAEMRFSAAQGSDSAAHVMLLLKQFDRALTATQLTCPQRVLCGIAENNGYLQLMMVYSDPHSDGSPDPSITMNFKLPVQEEDA